MQPRTWTSPISWSSIPSLTRSHPRHSLSMAKPEGASSCPLPPISKRALIDHTFFGRAVASGREYAFTHRRRVSLRTPCQYLRRAFHTPLLLSASDHNRRFVARCRRPRWFSRWRRSACRSVSRYIDRMYRVVIDQCARHQLQRRPCLVEERFATAEHERPYMQVIFVD
jgi:hypothetical protein